MLENRALFILWGVFARQGRYMPMLWHVASKMNKDKIWENFVEESRKAIAEDETKLFDAIMDAGAAARIQGKGEFPYRKYIKEEQMERFSELQKQKQKQKQKPKINEAKIIRQSMFG